MKAIHTSLTSFEKFDAAFIGSSTSWRGIAAGFFFSTNPKQASHIAEGDADSKWITYQVDLDIINPATAANYDEAEAKWGTEDAATAALTAAGHDALILANGEEIVVWDTNKIKIVSKI